MLHICIKKNNIIYHQGDSLHFFSIYNVEMRLKTAVACTVVLVI